MSDSFWTQFVVKSIYLIWIYLYPTWRWIPATQVFLESSIDSPSYFLSKSTKFFPALVLVFSTFDISELHDAQHHCDAILVVEFCYQFSVFFDKSSCRNTFHHFSLSLLISIGSIMFSNSSFRFNSYKCTCVFLT